MFDWPRGKHNNQRIVGFEIKFWVDVSMLRWWPLMRWNFGAPYLVWLCFRLSAEGRYSHEGGK